MAVRHSRLFATLILACTLPLAALAGETPHWVHYKLINNTTTLPKKVVVIPASVRVFEVTAGDVKEEVPEWSTEASNNVLKSVSDAISKDSSMQEVKMPRLSAADAEVVDEHMALYKLVVNTASKTDLEHKVKRFDFGIGPGLSTLQRKTGADAVVMVYGRDHVSTAGRKTKAVLGNIPFVNIFTGAPPELGHSYIHIGMIDLKTGDLLWMNSEYRDGASNLRDANDANDIVATVFEWYPGIEKYRDAYVK